MIGSVWGVLEAYTYFKGDKLKQLTGSSWILIYIAPVVLSIIVAYLNSRRLDRHPAEIILVDIGTTNTNYNIQETGNSIIFSPQLSLQDEYDRVGELVKLPVVLDVKLLNNGDETAYLKKIQVHVTHTQLDRSPVISCFPAIMDTDSENHLLLVIRNYGWGKVNVQKLIPLISTVTQFLKVDNEKMKWAGEITDAIAFLLPSQYIDPKKCNLLTEDQLAHIESILGPLRLSSKEDKQRVRDTYLINQQAVNYENFNGEITYNDNHGKIIRKNLAWGRANGYQDLLFSEEGFYLQSLPIPRGYIHPSYNYNLSLSTKDYRKVKVLSTSQEIQPNKAERFTITINSKESAIYQIKFQFCFNDSQSITSKVVHLHILSFREQDNTPNLMLMHDGQWQSLK